MSPKFHAALLSIFREPDPRFTIKAVAHDLGWPSDSVLYKALEEGRIGLEKARQLTMFLCSRGESRLLEAFMPTNWHAAETIAGVADGSVVEECRQLSEAAVDFRRAFEAGDERTMRRVLREIDAARANMRAEL